MLADCKDLSDYFHAYGKQLGARASDALAPLHVPGRDPVLPAVAVIDAHFHTARKSRLYPAQQHVASAIVKAWRRQKSVILNGECGTGKSALGSGSAHMAALSAATDLAGVRPYRGCVMCPDHLLDKWAREIHDTIPGARVRRFHDWRQVLAWAQSGERPRGPEWLLVGRDQSKFEPTTRPAFAARRVLAQDPFATRRLMRKGATWDDLSITAATCPRCGAAVTDKDGNPIPVGDITPGKRLTCKGEIVQYRTSPDGTTQEVTSLCGEPLWQYTRKPCRWAPARIIHQQGIVFDYLIADEVHEEKSAVSAQANALGKLIACSRKVIALTGTLIGGYAEHLFPLLFRLDARSLVADGFGWGDVARFNAKYGRIETTIHRTDRESPAGRRNTHSMGQSTRVTKRCMPGVMPQFFGDHLIDKVVFLSLAEVSEGLPTLVEEIIPIPMGPELAKAHNELEAWFRQTIKALLVKGDKRMLGTMLHTLLGYPDLPHDWGPIRVDDDEFTPEAICPAMVQAKEATLVALAKREKALGRQTWIYVQMTQLRDVGDRLVGILKEAGLRADYLRSSVDRRKREQWIEQRGKSLDVVISHPKLVETGLDLFSKAGTHNYATLAFYQTGYQLFTIRQAGRRHWRIGQPLPCKTCFLYYEGTMQARAMAHVGRKMVASEALEGKFSADGLAAMAGDDDAVMALARALVARVEAPVARAWSKSLGFENRAQPARPAPAARPANPSADDVRRTLQLYEPGPGRGRNPSVAS